MTTYLVSSPETKQSAHSRTKVPTEIDEKLFKAAEFFPGIWSKAWSEAQRYFSLAEESLQLAAHYEQAKDKSKLDYIALWPSPEERTKETTWASCKIRLLREGIILTINSADFYEYMASWSLQNGIREMLRSFPRDAQASYDNHFMSPENRTEREWHDEELFIKQIRSTRRERDESIKEWMQSCVTGIHDQETMLELHEIQANLVKVLQFNDPENRLHLEMDRINRTVKVNLMRMERLARWREGLYELPPVQKTERSLTIPVRPPIYHQLEDNSLDLSSVHSRQSGINLQSK